MIRLTFIQRRERVHDLHRLQADAGDSFEDVHDVAGVVVLLASVIGIVRDARGFVDGYLITLHDPFKRWLAVDDAVVGLQQNARERLEVRGKTAAVFRGMQDAVILIENVGLAHGLAELL